MNKSTLRVSVDPEKIMSVVRARGGSKQAISLELGHESNYITGVINRYQTMAKTDYILFKTLYGVDIKKDEDKEEVTAAPVDDKQDDTDLLSKLDELIWIGQLILNEVKAWNEPMPKKEK